VLLLFEGDCELFFGDLELLFRRLMPDWLELILALIPVGIGYYQTFSMCTETEEIPPTPLKSFRSGPPCLAKRVIRLKSVGENKSVGWWQLVSQQVCIAGEP
jgi:hypothetical protein